MYFIGHEVYYLRRVGFRRWVLKNGGGRVQAEGSRGECLEEVARLRREARSVAGSGYVAVYGGREG